MIFIVTSMLNVNNNHYQTNSPELNEEKKRMVVLSPQTQYYNEKCRKHDLNSNPKKHMKLNQKFFLEIDPNV